MAAASTVGGRAVEPPDGHPDNAKAFGYALQTATRPEFDRAPNELTPAHEVAHQWLGDGVTLTRWRDIWVNEGFAEWSSWYWSEHTGQTSAR